METVLYYLVQIASAKTIKALLSAIAIGLGWLTGGINEVVWALFFLIGMDFCLGFAWAWKNNNVSSKRYREGLGKFITYGATIIVGNLLDVVFFHKTNVDYGWRNAFMVYLAIHESLSVCKHLINFDVPLPKKLIKKLENYRDEVSISNP